MRKGYISAPSKQDIAIDLFVLTAIISLAWMIFPSPVAGNLSQIGNVIRSTTLAG